MKKTLSYLVFLIALITVAKNDAIGQLQYSGVKLISSSQTVPQGKVWKIESILGNQYEMVNINISGTKILVNNNPVYFYEHSSPCLSSDNTFFPVKLPMWLPENTALAPSTGVVYISVIEFNVVP